MTKYGLIFSGSIFVFIGYGQSDTSDALKVNKIDLEEVNISRVALRVDRIINPAHYVSDKTIQELALADLGEIVQKLPGANVRSYGALGGLKTVSFRGLGANHTGIVLNGFPVFNSQVGLTNLAQFPSESISGISEYRGGNSYGMPISAEEQGSAIQINTFEDHFKRYSGIQLRSSIKLGSFQTGDTYVGARYSGEKYAIGVFGKYRQSAGNYGYLLENGSTTEARIRTNNSYQDINYGISYNRDLNDRTLFRIGYKGKLIDQELPGAVILYNETADETLNTNDHFVYSSLTRTWDMLSLNVYGQGNANQMIYRDPTFLNTLGFVQDEYQNNAGLIGARVFKRLNRFTLNLGTEQRASFLRTNFSNTVNRFHNYAKAGATYFTRPISISAGLTSQMAKDNFGANSRGFFQLSPAVAIESKFSRNQERYIVLGLNYKRSYRLPTFNEMYYGNIGNADLLPEIADQVTYTFILDKYDYSKLFLWRIDVTPYAAIVKNKIVSIPSNNMFIWSIDNVDKVASVGAEAQFKLSKEKRDTIFENWGVWNSTPFYDLTLGYNFQYVVDITDPNSATYGDQIAYTPRHTLNLIASYYIRSFGAVVSNYFVSNRYVLNENNYQNLESGYLVTDLSLLFKKRIKAIKRGRVQSLTANLTVKNLFNVQYAFIRSFVMPGRSFTLSLNYALD